MKDIGCFSVEREKIIVCTSKRYELLKRLFDILISFLGLVVFFPLLLLLMVYMSYKFYGPVFTYREVLGYRGRSFKIYRFYNRKENDERIIGYIESSLNQCPGERMPDEELKITVLDNLACSKFITTLLQLVNVLKGDMSIVGPKPKDGCRMESGNKWYCVRLSARPGIIGLWDAYKRYDDGFDEMVWFDLKYLKERRLMYDMKIIARVLISRITHNKKW